MINVHHALISTISPPDQDPDRDIAQHGPPKRCLYAPGSQTDSAALSNRPLTPVNMEHSKPRRSNEERSQETTTEKTKSQRGSPTPSTPKQSPSRPLPKVPQSSSYGRLRTESKGQRVNFEDFVSHTRAHNHHIERALEFQWRQFNLQATIGIHARLLRTSRQVHNHLVECLRHGDKPGFVDILRTVQELQDSIAAGCPSPVDLGSQYKGPNSRPQTATLDRRKSISQLSPNSKQTIVELVHLVRTDPNFLTSRIRSLSHAQFSALVSCPQYLDRAQSVLPRPPRYSSSIRRNTTFSSSVKERALSLERSSPFSALLFNAYSPCCRPGSVEARLRMETWSSACAELFNWSEHAYQPIIHQALNAFAGMCTWRAKPKVELFLMDLLQRGAFLLETSEEPFAQSGTIAERLDTFRTDAAQEFFDSAVQDLFEILDDVDGGLPSGALQFGLAILGKLDDPGKQSRFRGLMFFQWFLCDFLSSCIVYPENVEAMLNYSICKDAREKILHQVTLRLQAQTSNILNPLAFGPSTPPTTRAHVEQMVSKLVETKPADNDKNFMTSTTEQPMSAIDLASSFLLLSLDDILCIVDTCFPRPTLSPTSWDQLMTSGSPDFPPVQRMSFSENSNERSSADIRGPISVRTKAECTNLDQSSTHDVRSRVPSKDLIRNVDRLRRELASFFDSSTNSTCHPMSAQWTVFNVESDGKLSISLDGRLNQGPTSSGADCFHLGQLSSSVRSEEKQDTVQAAVLKLVHEDRPLTSSLSSSLSLPQSAVPQPSLEFLFQEKLDACRARADAVQAHFWWSALNELRNKYPLCLLSHDDTRVLKPLLTASGAKATDAERQCSSLEESFGRLKSSLDELREAVELISQTQNKLRDKMWYLADVKNSNDYENAKSVALALRNMTVVGENTHGKFDNPARGRLGMRALTGVLFNHVENQTINVMKAAREHGGPKKLSDDQINITQKWLQRAGVENFCRGEERIHRFCVEVKTTSQKLIGETLSNGPVLWSSELFSRERATFNNQPPHTISTLSSSRPSSIVGEECFQSFSQLHFNSRLESSSRIPATEGSSSPRKFSFPSLSSERWKFGREHLGSEISSIGDSPGKTTISSGTESITSFWSPAMSHTHSATTAPTTVSRPSSIYNLESGPKQASDRPNSESKLQFLTFVRNNLTALLLSDLSTPTWSCGSETDAWLWAILDQHRIQSWLEKRSTLRKLLTPSVKIPGPNAPKQRRVPRQLKQKRSLSAGRILDERKSRTSLEACEVPSHPKHTDSPDHRGFSYNDGFTQLLARFSRCAGPDEKLLALTEFHELVVTYISSGTLSSFALRSHYWDRSKPCDGKYQEQCVSGRRQSLIPASQNSVKRSADPRSLSSELKPTEKDVVNALKHILMSERPKTLFRDLQFISAFVPPEVLNNATNGTAFLQVSLAALSLKDEVCQAMVDIADRTIARRISQPTLSGQEMGDSHLKDAANFWVICAKEGNAIAQRELAGLYLSRPDFLPRVTMPLTLARDCFRTDGLRKLDTNMCLAMHWMKLSARNGDELAINKLKEYERNGTAFH